MHKCERCCNESIEVYTCEVCHDEVCYHCTANDESVQFHGKLLCESCFDKRQEKLAKYYFLEKEKEAKIKKQKEALNKAEADKYNSKEERQKRAEKAQLELKAKAESFAKNFAEFMSHF